MMVINKENIEEYLLLLIDGELSAADEMEVMTFIESHNECQVLLDQYMDTKLEMEDIVFEDKETLLKREENVILFRKKKTILFAAAGIMAVLFAGTVFKLMMRDDTTFQRSVAIVRSASNRNADAAVKDTMTMASNKHPAIKKSTGSTSIVTPLNVVKNISSKQQLSSANAVIAINTSEHIDPLQPLPAAALQEVNITSEAKINEALLPAVALTFDEVEKKSNGMLPDASRLEGLNDLLSQMETLKDKIADKSKIFKNMTVAIRVGGKEFTIGK